MTIDRKKTVIIFLAPIIILLIPLIAMQFTSEVSWNGGDFSVATILLYGAATMTFLFLYYIKDKQTRLAIITATIVLLIITWMELAVGIFGTPFAGS